MSSYPTIKAYLGKGWPMPVIPDTNSRELPFVFGSDKVRQSIWCILHTEPGERVMRPDFGCGLRAYLMKPNTSATRALIKREVERALTNWEPRIQLQAVEVQRGQDTSQVDVIIHYEHIRDGSTNSLVFPFSLEAR